MPKPPRIQSERLRQIVVSTAMVLLLALSLALAYAFTQQKSDSRRVSAEQVDRVAVTIGPLRVEVPSPWRPLKTPAPLMGLGQAYSLFTSPEHAQDKLLVGLLPNLSVKSPSAMLEQVKQTLLPNQPVTVTSTTRIRQGQRVILVASMQQAEPSGQIQLYHLAVFTDTGRHHGLVMLSQAYTPNQRQRSEAAFDVQPLALVADLAQAARFDELRLATPAMLQSAGIARAKPTSLKQSRRWLLATCDDAGLLPSIWLLPTDGPSAFWCARMRGGPALPITPTQADPTYSPSSLLTQVTPPGDEQLAGDDVKTIPPGPEDGLQIWRQPWPGNPVDLSLERERWLVTWPKALLPAGHDGSMVVDLLFEPASADHARQQMRQALAQLTPVPSDDQTHANTDEAWQASLERGRSIAQTLCEDLPNRLDNQTTYLQYLRGPQTAGLAMAQTRLSDNAQAIQGRSILIQATSPRVVYEEHWAANADVSQAIITSRLEMVIPDRSPETIQRQDRLTLQEKRLTYATYELAATPSPDHPPDDAPATKPASMVPRWQQPVNDAYVPLFTMDLIPPQALARWASEPPTLLWTSLGQDKALALWFEVQLADDKDMPGSHWRVTLRPPAGIDPLILWFDDTGRCIQSQWHDGSAGHLPNWAYATRMVDRPWVMAQFESLQNVIEKWEKEWSADE